MGKDTDKLYITHSEWSTLDFGHGGFKAKPTGKEFKRLPFFCCSLGLTPFENPRCTKEGHIFDLMNIVPWLKKYGSNPVTGQPLAAKDLITLHFHKNAEGQFHDPITFKVFNENTHIVAVPVSGNVYAYETIEELNAKPKSWFDLITDEPFKKKDLITIQDPHNLTARDINQFHYKKNEVEMPEGVNTAVTQSSKPTVGAEGINARGTTARILAEMAPKSSNPDSNASSSSKVTPSYIPTKNKAYNQAHFSTNQVAASFTSMGAIAVTKNESAIYTDDEHVISKVKGNAYAQIKTNLGDINVELFCEIAPRTCFNFIMLSKTGFYKDILFHRVIPGFMAQTGDSTGTGKGGQSYFGYPFPDEINKKRGLSHDSKGILSMANRGPDTNQSQFFITFAECKHLDNKHTIFGKVVGGMSVVESIEGVPTEKDRPKVPIKVTEIVVLVDPYDEVRKGLVGEDYATLKKKQQEELRQAKRAANAKVTAVPPPSAAPGGVGKYLATALKNKRPEDEESEALKAQAEDNHTKKKNKSSGFGDFSSW